MTPLDWYNKKDCEGLYKEGEHEIALCAYLSNYCKRFIAQEEKKMKPEKRWKEFLDYLKIEGIIINSVKTE